jgi:hypothetical protein
LANSTFTVKDTNSKKAKFHLNGAKNMSSDYTNMVHHFSDIHMKIKKSHSSGTPFNNTNSWGTLGRRMALINAQTFFSQPQTIQTSLTDKKDIWIDVSIILGTLVFVSIFIAYMKCYNKKNSTEKINNQNNIKVNDELYNTEELLE